MALLLLLCGASCRAREKEVLYIGVVGSLPEYDDTMFKGIHLYVDQVNRAGGVDGRRIELIEMYDQGDPDKARELAQKLVADGALVVIGHSWSSTSIAGGEVYRKAHVPAITASATALAVTKGNEWYFRTVFNNELQGRLIAYYVGQVLGHRRVGVVTEQDAYGRTLSDAFVRATAEAGIQLERRWQFAPDEADLEGTLGRIAREICAANLDMVFLAVQYTEGIQLVAGIRDLGGQVAIMGDDAIGTQTFPNEFDRRPREQEQPGYYTDGVYAPAFLIFDVADDRAQDFKLDFEKRYDKEPDALAAVYYDAAALAIKAIVESGAANVEVAEGRRLVRDYLAGINAPERAFIGVTGPIYFDADGDAVTGLMMGMFKSRRLISAPVQLEPIGDPTLVPNLEEAVRRGRVLALDGRYMYRTMVVYTGLDFDDIGDLDTGDGTYTMDFYIWFRYYGDFDPSEIEFLNAAGPLKLGKPVSEESENDGTTYRLYRVKATFKGEFDLHDYPFDHQVLALRFYHRGMTRHNLIYVVDDLGMRIPGRSLLEHLRENVMGNATGWRVDKYLVFQDTLTRSSTLGNPRFSRLREPLRYSRFNVEVHIERDVLSYSIKNLFPVFILILVCYLVLYMPARVLPPRVSICVTTMLTTAFFSARLSSDLPRVGYLTTVEYVFFVVYVLALFALVVSILDYQHDEDWVRRLIVVGRIGYPLVVVVVLGVIALVYLL